MGLFLAALGGVILGIVLRRLGSDLPTRFIFNAVVFGVIIAQTVLYFVDGSTLLSPGALLTVLIVLWGADMVKSWQQSQF